MQQAPPREWPRPRPGMPRRDAYGTSQPRRRRDDPYARYPGPGDRYARYPGPGGRAWRPQEPPPPARIRVAYQASLRLARHRHHHVQHFHTQARPWLLLLAAVLSAGTSRAAVLIWASPGARSLVISLTWALPAWAAWHYQSRQRKLLRRAYAAACPLIFAGWVTWVTQAGIHHSGAIAWVLLIPGWLALALPWWYAHPPAQPDPPPGDPDDAPEGDPLISRWADEVAVSGLLPGSALSSPQDIGAGTRYVCALRKGMTLEDAAQVQRKVASVLGIGRHRLLFEHHGEHPGRADNESVISLAVLNPVTRQDSSQVWEGPTLDTADRASSRSACTRTPRPGAACSRSSARLRRGNGAR